MLFQAVTRNVTRTFRSVTWEVSIRHDDGASVRGSKHRCDVRDGVMLRAMLRSQNAQKPYGEKDCDGVTAESTLWGPRQ
jgi:hypothetical protein